MLKNVTLGTYYPGKSLIHRLQARTKLLTLFWIIVCMLVANQRLWHFATIILMLSFFCVSVALARIPVRDIWQRMWLLVLLLTIGSISTLFVRVRDIRVFFSLGPLLISYGLARTALLVIGGISLLVLLTSALPLAFLRELWKKSWLRRTGTLLTVLLIGVAIAFWLLSGLPDEQVLKIGPLNATYGGTWLAIISPGGLLILYGFSLVMTMTTTPVAFVEGMTLLLSPLRRLKLPVDDFALMTLLALRFIPTIFEEIEQLNKAQAARGADVTTGTVRQRLQSLSMLFVPLVRSALRRAAELATALEARGYEVEGQQPMLHETSFGLRDYVVLAIVVVLTVGTFLL
jgi:energy-coupling factor transport system permease protein